jgi:hypothetical protein
MTTENIIDENRPTKSRVGIKNIKFNNSGTNGASHRKGAVARKVRHERNMRARAELYSKFQGRNSGGAADAAEFHSGLKAISLGLT